MLMDSAFRLLGLSDCGFYGTAVVEAAYRRLALKLHPDKPCGSEEAFKLLGRARAICVGEEPAARARRKDDEACAELCRERVVREVHGVFREREEEELRAEKAQMAT